MKTFVVLTVSIVLVSMLFCPMAMAAPPMPNDVQIVEPDPSLPKEIAGFWGKWEGTSHGSMKLFVIVEKIDGEKATLYRWNSDFLGTPEGWRRVEAKITKEYGKYKLWYRAEAGQTGGIIVEYTLKGKYLDITFSNGNSGRLTRVP